ncbi:MAG: alpha/beta hydrolase [Candidatus Nanopelagicales bacterium]|jgi:pimeloyl-ACP methyl ester carboxylesterase|tara:strand:+ start:1139 stop:2074 length:936 start_codon:yes stop_codon:yes gene_type:complete
MHDGHENDDDFDEFSFVEADAARLSLEPPFLSVRRRAFVSEGGEALSALVWGETAPEAVYLHGAGLNGHSWDSTILASGEPAIAFDLPGHGDSAWRDSAEYDPGSLSIPLAATISGLEGPSYVLVGQSLGGLAAIAIADIVGPRVSHLVIVDVTPGHRIAGAPNSRISEFIAGPESYASRAEVIERAIAFGIGRNAEDLERGVKLNTKIRSDGRVVFKHHLAALPAGAHNSSDAKSLWPTLEKLDVPILLVCASEGILNSDQILEFTTRTRNASTVTIKAGHNVQHDAPLELAAAIAEFVQPVSPTTTRTK